MAKKIFRNYSDLANTPARRLALDIAAAGLAALAPEILLEKSLYFNRADRVLEIMGVRYSLAHGRIFVIGGGKAADVMAAALENILGSDTITAGVVICKTQSAFPKKIQVREAGHPIPDERGLHAMSELMGLKAKHEIGKNDLVLCLLSGGASALMPYPAPGISLGDKQQVTSLLLASGADISEINIVRKNLSASKGGKLGLHFAPATVISLIVSDVIGNDLSVIGSGPTTFERNDPGEATKLIQQYELWDKIPETVRFHFESNADADVTQEPRNILNHIIGDSNTALEAMKEEAEKMGRRPLILTRELKGEPEAAARMVAENILAGKYHDLDILLAAGETTPKLPGNSGKGGRNQHFAAATLLDLETLPGDWAHLSLASDGSDYLPDVAGALVDHAVLEQTRKHSLSIRDYLDRFDSYAFFQKTGDCLVETGPTGTNIGDLMIYVL